MIYHMGFRRPMKNLSRSKRLALLETTTSTNPFSTSEMYTPPSDGHFGSQNTSGPGPTAFTQPPLSNSVSAFPTTTSTDPYTR